MLLLQRDSSAARFHGRTGRRHCGCVQAGLAEEGGRGETEKPVDGGVPSWISKKSPFLCVFQFLRLSDDFFQVPNNSHWPNCAQALAFRHLDIEATPVRSDFFREAMLEMLEVPWFTAEQPWPKFHQDPYQTMIMGLVPTSYKCCFVTCWILLGRVMK